MKIRELILGLLLLSSIGIVSGCSTIEIRTAIEIDAPPEEVYAVLAKLEAYPGWNPYHRKVAGEFEEGASLSINVLRPDGKEVDVPPHMLRIVENKEITWGGGIPGIFYGVHSFLLEEKTEHKTLLKHNESFSGFAIQFADLPPEVIADGYHQMNIALKTKLEGNQREK